MSQGSLPLSALLSQALVAFTIEFDNAAELQIQHRTSRHSPADRGLWLTSMAMWLNCMRYVGAEPITLGEVRRRARTDTNLDGMRRWGYLTVEPGPGDPKYRAKSSRLVLRATQRGMQASEIWQPLTGTIEQRWADRYGAAGIGRLRATLAQLASQFGPWLPDCLPILGPADPPHPCSAGSTRPRATGVRTCGRRGCCRISRWCCTGEVIPMAASIAGCSFATTPCRR
ncbi:MAG TPA: hypothetical protein VGI66_12845 [Streptosporangiaceae bacterium]|jgi:hypothetical protein